MLPWVVQWLWISLALPFVIVSLLRPTEVRAQAPVRTNSDDHIFGWLATGTLSPGQLPVCTFCVNVLVDGRVPLHVNLNRTVGLYRCNGAEFNEIWAYRNSTSSLVFSNLTQNLCLDALLWESSLLTLLPCNASVVSQQWKYENNQLLNGLIDSNGQNLFLLTGLPDPEKDPTVQNYTYPLFIGPSTPTYDTSYSSHFTFLPTPDSINISSDIFTTKALLQISNTSQGLIANGGFENCTIPAGPTIASSTSNTLQAKPSYFALCGWVIDTGPIDYVKAGLLPPANGSYSIHLNSYTDADYSGSISQTFPTKRGERYIVSFYLNALPPDLDITGRPLCSAAYRETGARLQVQVAKATTTYRFLGLPGSIEAYHTHNFTSNVTGLTAQNMGASWKEEALRFKAASDATTIFFRSLNFNASCGPMIDTVEVSHIIPTPVPEQKRSFKMVAAVAGPIGGLAFLIAIILSVLCRVSNGRMNKDYYCSYNIEHTRVYSVKELSIATKKFSSVLGEGGFGTVYKAEFPDGTVGAVKVEKLKPGLNSRPEDLVSQEIDVLLRVHHRNLVNLIGLSINQGQRILVFEYLPNGNLYSRLHQSTPPTTTTGSNLIPWKQRVKIVADIACGLEYLHHQADPPIVHRDVKSRNILLTTTNFAKLADFGLSKVAPTNATSFQSIETLVRGSLGYLDPQYMISGIFSPKSDVYSFGVVVLELISGHPAIYNSDLLPLWASPYLTCPSLYHELVDEALKDDFRADELECLVELFTMCTQHDGKMRPNMRQVVAFLNSKQLPSIKREHACESMEAMYQAGAFPG